jgi:LmbE family N-acetylglucosaminyl deacetylase
MVITFSPPSRALPGFRRVLAVGAHPDDESFGLGAVLDTLIAHGTQVWLLSFTRGEASTLGNELSLAEVRARELADAATELGAAGVRLLAYADGSLDRAPAEELAKHVRVFADQTAAEALLVFDSGGITGHPDHRQATRAARLAAETLGIPVLAWAIPSEVADRLNGEFGTAFTGVASEEVDFSLHVDRTRQVAAIARHRSQSADNPVLWRRLQLLGDTEWLRYLSPSITKGSTP